jgi:hypothetical protein
MMSLTLWPTVKMSNQINENNISKIKLYRKNKFQYRNRWRADLMVTGTNPLQQSLG